jgi:hypothetical protein
MDLSRRRRGRGQGDRLRTARPPRRPDQPLEPDRVTSQDHRLRPGRGGLDHDAGPLAGRSSAQALARHRSWILPRDPDLAAKAGRVLDLYQRTFQGQSLRGNDYVICADEKSSIQARCRGHPTLPAGQGSMRVEHEYDRGGALAYLAA